VLHDAGFTYEGIGRANARAGGEPGG
jgi:hypothetical protein